LFNYGLPDVTSLSHESATDRARLLEMVEQTIATFEPRLSRVKVTSWSRRAEQCTCCGFGSKAGS